MNPLGSIQSESRFIWEYMQRVFNENSRYISQERFRDRVMRPDANGLGVLNKSLVVALKRWKINELREKSSIFLVIGY
jgi:hypothetical protein